MCVCVSMLDVCESWSWQFEDTLVLFSSVFILRVVDD